MKSQRNKSIEGLLLKEWKADSDKFSLIKADSLKECSEKTRKMDLAAYESQMETVMKGLLKITNFVEKEQRILNLKLIKVLLKKDFIMDLANWSIKMVGSIMDFLKWAKSMELLAGLLQQERLGMSYGAKMKWSKRYLKKSLRIKFLKNLNKLCFLFHSNSLLSFFMLLFNLFWHFFLSHLDSLLSRISIWISLFYSFHWFIHVVINNICNFSKFWIEYTQCWNIVRLIVNFTWSFPTLSRSHWRVIWLMLTYQNFLFYNLATERRIINKIWHWLRLRLHWVFGHWTDLWFVFGPNRLITPIFLNSNILIFRF